MKPTLLTPAGLFGLVVLLFGTGDTAKGAVIPPEKAIADIFDAKIISVTQMQDAVEGLQLRIPFTGLAGRSYHLRGSMDLLNWTLLGTQTATGGSGLFKRPYPDGTRRFYRVEFSATNDNVAPAWPGAAAITAGFIAGDWVDLDWPAANDNTGVLGYALYRNGIWVSFIINAASGAYIPGLEPSTEYEFDVVACDAGGNVTQMPGTLTIRTRPQQEPYLNAAWKDGVSLSSGEFVLSRTDMSIPGRELSLHFTRTYRSQVERSGPLGYGWTANVFEMLKARHDGSMIWLQGDGRADTFVKQTDGSFTSPQGFMTQLFPLPDGFRLIDPGGTVRRFDPQGKIVSITTRNGNAHTNQYDGTGRLTSVTDEMGHVVTFSYNLAGTLASIADFTGREVHFSYDAVGNLTSARSPVVTSGVMLGDSFPNGKTEVYLYDTANAVPQIKHNLKQIISPNENGANDFTPRHTIAVGYDSGTFDRVLSSTDGGTNASGVPSGGTTTFTYTPSAAAPGRVTRTAVRDARLFNVLCDFDNQGRLSATTEELPGRNDPLTVFTYNADGNILSITHPEGNVTSFTWDSGHSSRRSQGNLLSVSRTPGPRGGTQAELTTRFTYEPVFNQVRTVVNPRHEGGIHDFDYQEGCDFAAIGAKVGLSAAAAQTLLNNAGLCLTPLGDVNGDGVTNQSGGNLIRQTLPAATLFAGGQQALAEGDTSQGMVNLFTSNALGQMTTHVDAEQNVHTFTYWPERDPDGDGIINNPSGNATTGGWLKQRTDDTASAPGRNSGQDTAPVNRRIQWKYNARGAVTGVTDPRGVITDILRNNLDQVTRVRRAFSVDPSLVPDPAEPVALTAFGYFEMFAYDANNNLIRRDVEDRGNTSNTGGVITTAWQYDIRNLLVEKSEEIDSATTATTRWRYCSNGNLALMIRAEGNAISWGYDLRGLPISITTGALTIPPEALTNALTTPFNPRGGTPSTRTQHWSDNRLPDSAADAADTDGSAANNGVSGGDMTVHVYDGFDRRISSVDPAGNRTAWSYDANGNCTQEQHFGPNGGPAPLTNTPSANLLSQTSFVYDQADRLVQTNHLLFSASLPAADIAEGATAMGKGNLVPGDSAVNSRYEYDRLGRLTAVYEDDGDFATCEYDGAGRVIRRTDPAGNQMEYARDDADNLIESRQRDLGTGGLSEPEVFLTTHFYDAAGRVATTVNNLGHTTRCEYDSRDNLIAASDGKGPLSGTIARRAFPDAFLTVNATNSHGNVTRRIYDGRNLMIFNAGTITSSGNGSGTMTPVADSSQGGGDGLSTCRYFYDRNGLLTSRRDDNGFSTAFSYDNLNRLKQASRGACTGPALAGYSCETATTISYTYDPDGNITQKTDEAGNVFSNSYDALNRLKQTNIARAPGVGGVTQQMFEYDGLFRTTKSTDNGFNGTVTNIYDSLGRVVRETLEIPGTGTFTHNSAWRAANLRTGLTYSTGTALTYTYDAADRLKHIQDASSTVADYDYIGGRLLEERFGNGAKNSHVGGYDGLGQPLQVESRRNGGALLARFNHTRDRAGNRLTETKTHDSANNQTYSYDSLRRLVSFTRPAPGAAAPLHSSWSLDGTGNWKSVDGATRNISSFNEINSITPLLSAAVPLAYDDNGNLKSNPSAQGGASTYQFDAFNRLIGANVSGGSSLSYAYDATGRRLLETDGASRRIIFLHDGEQPIADWDAHGTLIGTPGTAGRLREYVQGPGVSRPARMQNAAGIRFYYHYDSLGSITALTPAATLSIGAEFVRYEAYGTPAVSQTGGLAATGNPFLFNGQRRCFSTSLYLCGDRHYDSGLGCFLSRDPHGGWDGKGGDIPVKATGNAYALSGNNPVNLVFERTCASDEVLAGLRGQENPGQGRFNGKYYVMGVTHRHSAVRYQVTSPLLYNAGSDFHWGGVCMKSGDDRFIMWSVMAQDNIQSGAGPGEVFGPHVRNRSGAGPGPVFGPHASGILSGAGPGAVFGPHFTGAGPGPIFAPHTSGILSGAGPGAVFGPHFTGPGPGPIFAPHTSGILSGAGPGDVFGPHFTGPGPGPIFAPHTSGILCGAGPGDVFGPHFTGAGPGPIFAPHTSGLVTGAGPGPVFAPHFSGPGPAGGSNLQLARRVLTGGWGLSGGAKQGEYNGYYTMNIDF